MRSFELVLRSWLLASVGAVGCRPAGSSDVEAPLEPQGEPVSDDGSIAAGLAALQAIDVTVDPRELRVLRAGIDDARPRFFAHMARQWTPELADAQIVLLWLLMGEDGLRPMTRDEFMAAASEGALGGVAAFFDASDHTMVLIEGGRAALAKRERLVVHELVHAYQDQLVPGGLPGLMARARTLDDLRVQQLALEGHAQAITLAARLHEDGRRLDEVDPDEARPGLERLLGGEWLAIYALGEHAALSAYRERGREGLDDLLRHPARSSEQLLHPAKLGRDPPVEIAAPELPGATVRLSTVVGELSLVLLLNTMGATDEDAFVVGQGWGGDRLVLYEHEGQPLVVWRTQWDRPEDAAAFARVMETLPTRNTASVVQQRDNGVDLVMAANVGRRPVAEAIAQALPPVPAASPLAAELSAEVEGRFLAQQQADLGIVRDGVVELPTLGLELPLPEGWRYVRIKGSHSLMGAEQDGYSDNVTVVVQVQHDQSLARMADDLRASAQRVGTMDVLVLEPRRLGSHEVMWAELAGTWPGQPAMHQLGVMVLHRGQAVQLYATTLASRWREAEATLRQVLEGIRFLD